MPELYIDPRNDATLVLLMEKGAVLYGHAFPQKVTDGESLRQLVALVRTESGLAFKSAHLLVPGSELTTRLHRTQATAMADARLIIGRALAAETGEASPLFLLTRMAVEHAQQVYLTEILPRPALDKYLLMFREARLRLLTVITSFQSRQAFLPHLPGEVHQIQSLFDIGGDGGIEATFFSSTEILQHEVLPGNNTSSGPVTESADEAERSGRRRLYETMNNLHIVYSRFMNQHPQAVMGKIWLGGTGCDSAGLAEGMAEALGLDVGLLIPDEVKALPNGQMFVDMIGCSRLLQARKAVNLLPRELLTDSWFKGKQVLPVVAALALLVLVTTLGLTENRYRLAKNDLAAERTALQSLQASSGEELEQLKALRKVRDLTRSQPNLYGLFAELTLLLPPGVYLENMDYQIAPVRGKSLVKLQVVIDYDGNFDSWKLLSQFMAALGTARSLSHPEEPVITYRTVAGHKLMVVVVTCTAQESKVGG